MAADGEPVTSTGRTGKAPLQTLRDQGLRPRKRLGQTFLRDRSYLVRILSAAELSASDEVLEIGPGTGVLTRSLSAVARRVVAVELDDSLVALLRREFDGQENVEIVQGNALDLEPGTFFDGAYKLVANIPYYITGPLVRYFLESSSQPSILVLMVQREVAERMAAPPGHLSLLGVSVQFYAAARIMARVPRAAFVPRPKVDSAIIRLLPTRRADSADPFQSAFFTVVRAGFLAKRKQLTNSLMMGLSVGRADIESVLAASGIDGQRRAETLSIPEWESLSATWLQRQQQGGA